MRRRPGDAVRVVVAVALLVAFACHTHSPTATERAVVRVFDSIPDEARTLVLILYDVTGIWALALLASTALVVRRWRLARDMLVAGGLAWMLGRLLAFVVGDTDLWTSLQITFDLTDTPRFPLVRLGMAVAAVAVASAHLTRPVRRVGQGLLVLLAVTAMYLGRAYPTDVLAAVVLGWGVAAAVRYAFGTPAGRPTVGQVEAALERLRVQVGDLRPATEQVVGRAVFLADSRAGRRRVTAIGRDEADAQWLARAWRWVAYRDAPPMLLPTRRQQVEYEAYVALLARESGVATPRVVLAGASGPLALLVEEEIDGTPLQDLPDGDVDDALLDRIWREVVLLHAALITHGKLDGKHVVVDSGMVRVVGYDQASTSTGFNGSAGDVAQLLAATAAKAGPARAAAAAVRGVGADEVAAALPILQPPAISGWTHDALGGRGQLDDKLEELRAAGAEATGTEQPALRPVFRVHPRSLLMAVGALVGVAVLLSRVGDPAEFWNSIGDASWGWVALAFVLGILTDAAFGIAFLGNVPVRLPIWPSVELQMAMSFSNLAVPVAADAALQIRFLQRNGLDLSSAVAAGGFLSTVSELIVQVGLFVLALWLAPDSIQFGRVDTGQIVVVVLIAVFAAGVVAAILFGVRRLRRVVLPPVKRAAVTVWRAVRTPSRLALLIGGNIVAQCLYAASLLACLYAFGASVNFWTLLALNIGISTIASLVPVPGGSTAVSAVGLAGMLTAFGVPETAATAAVLSHQLAVTYLPAIPGWFATNDLVRKGLL